MKQRVFAVTEYTFEDVRLLRTERNRGNGFSSLAFADASENDSIIKITLNPDEERKLLHFLKESTGQE